MVAVYHLLHGDALFSCANSNRHAVLIRATNKHHVLLLKAQIAHIDIRRNIHTCQMADMHAAVGIRKG